MARGDGIQYCVYVYRPCVWCGVCERVCVRVVCDVVCDVVCVMWCVCDVVCVCVCACMCVLWGGGGGLAEVCMNQVCIRY